MLMTKITGRVEYHQYLGILTAHRAFRLLKIVVSEPKDDDRYLELLLKTPGISALKVFEGDAIIMPDGDNMHFSSNSLTLTTYLKSNNTIPDGHFLFDNRESDTIPDKNLSYVELPEDHEKITPEFIATSNTIYAEIVKKLLSERVWNPFNEPVWGFEMGSPLPVRKMDKKFRFHLLGLAHLPTSDEYMSCAFTQKNYKLAKMLMDLGHEVILYGAEGSNAPCTTFVQTHTLKDIRNAWGEGDNRFEIGYDWKTGQFKHDFNAPRTETTKKFYRAAIQSINDNKRPDDFLLVTQGFYHKPIADKVNLQLTCEPGIGYRGSYAEYRAFESHYIQYFTYGSEHPRESINGKNYDRVIPNYYDLKDFKFSEKKKDYYLFVGRLINRKGLAIAIQTCDAIGAKLIVAGQRDPETEKLLKNPRVEFVGYADAKKRADLMANAIAVFTPSTYLEPFCGVHAEAMLCGTPVITTNFGAFTDYVVDGLNGYRCNTLQDFVDAARAVKTLNPAMIRRYATKFTLDSVKWEYQRWFQDLYRVWESIKDSNKKAWSHLE